MNDNSLIAQVIIAIVIIASVVGLIYVVKHFFFYKKQEKQSIHRSARNQSQLIDRRVKK